MTNYDKHKTELITILAETALEDEYLCSWSAAEISSIEQYIEWLQKNWDNEDKIYIMSDLMESCKINAAGGIEICNRETKCTNCIAADEEISGICHQYKITKWLLKEEK